MKIKYFPQNILAAYMIQYQKEAKNLIKKWAEDLNRPKKTTQMTNRQKKRCSTLLIIIEMQSKTTMGYYFALIIVSVIKSLQKINTGKSVEERDPSYTVSVNVDWYNHEGE